MINRTWTVEELSDRLADLVLDRLNQLDPPERAKAFRLLRSALAAEASVEVVDGALTPPPDDSLGIADTGHGYD